MAEPLVMQVAVCIGLCGRCKDGTHILAELLALEEPHCRLDHNGFCQSHGCSSPCLVARGRAFVEAAGRLAGGLTEDGKGG